jgi:hypothetical protein
VKFQLLGPREPRGPLVNAVNANARSPEAWQRYDDDKARFSVLFPSAPTRTVQDIRGVPQQVVMGQLVENTLFAVAYVKIDARGAGPDEILKRAQTGRVESNAGSSIKYERKMRLGNAHVIEYVAAGGLVVDATRIYVVIEGDKVHLYQVSLVTNEPALQAENAKRFFDSFRLG